MNPANKDIKTLNIKGMPANNNPTTTTNQTTNEQEESQNMDNMENENMDNMENENMDNMENESQEEGEMQNKNEETEVSNANTKLNNNKPLNNTNKPVNNNKSGNMNQNLTKMNKPNNNKRTKKRNLPENIDKLNKLCINMLNHQIAIKLYHFQTKRYGSHKASDSYLDKYMDLLDKFLEVAQGIHGRITIEKYDLSGSTKNDENIFQHLDDFSDYLENKINDVLANNTDLINIRDEIVGEINQLSYLLTFV